MPTWAWLIVVFGAFMAGVILMSCCAAASRADDYADELRRRLLGEVLARKAEKTEDPALACGHRLSDVTCNGIRGPCYCEICGAPYPRKFEDITDADEPLVRRAWLARADEQRCGAGEVRGD